MLKHFSGGWNCSYSTGAKQEARSVPSITGWQMAKPCQEVLSCLGMSRHNQTRWRGHLTTIMSQLSSDWPPARDIWAGHLQRAFIWCWPTALFSVEVCVCVLLVLNTWIICQSVWDACLWTVYFWSHWARRKWAWLVTDLSGIRHCQGGKGR